MVIIRKEVEIHYNRYAVRDVGCYADAYIDKKIERIYFLSFLIKEKIQSNSFYKAD
jgi:hypothetical protein